MPQKSKQHYIPRCYLKAWCDVSSPSGQTPYLWIFDRQGQGKNKSPDNIFHSRDLYTIKGINGERDLGIEDGLGGLEAKFASIRNRKFNVKEPLDPTEYMLILYFIAAMYVRTKSHIEFMSNQWRRPLEIMENMMQSYKDASPSQREKYIKASSTTASESSNSLSYEQVKKMVESPVETMLLPKITALAPRLSELDFSVLYTEDEQGFITSDRPCVWFDSEAHKRGRMYRTPALMYETIEITLPLSPSQMLFLNRRGSSGYNQITPEELDSLNQRTMAHCNKHFITNKNHIKDSWKT